MVGELTAARTAFRLKAAEAREAKRIKPTYRKVYRAGAAPFSIGPQLLPLEIERVKLEAAKRKLGVAGFLAVLIERLVADNLWNAVLDDSKDLERVRK